MTPPPPQAFIEMNLFFYNYWCKWIQKVFWTALLFSLFGNAFLVQIKAPPFEID